MNRSYKIFKLISGEEIICSVINRNNGSFTVIQPMIFKTITTLDPLGFEKEITFLKDWLTYAENKSTKIKENQVTAIIDPSTKVIKMYDAQKRKETIVKEFNTEEEPESKPSPNTLNDLMQDLLGMPKPNENSGIFKFEMDLSKKDFEDFVEKGLISKEFLDELISDMLMEDSMSDEYTGDEVDHPNFGNRWTDWENNPFDYLN